MPPNGTTGQGISMTEEELWQVITYLRSVENKGPAKPVGNAAHGQELKMWPLPPAAQFMSLVCGRAGSGKSAR